MEDRKQFEKLLKTVQIQLLIELVLKEVQLLLMFAGAMALLLLVMARMVIIPYIIYYFAGIIFALLIYFTIRIWRNRPKIQDAAAIYNTHIPDDRVITACSFLHSDSIVATLQLSDAVKVMKKSRESVNKRKKKFIYPKWLLLFLVFTAVKELAKRTGGNELVSEKDTFRPLKNKI
ncbi:hypothetical protein [Bacillus sp. S/N-304-OC-R1]|uniref:hypothetical protein n=1 Tax=Bacillus sp. S/N-304-OC-R1 TaxID=2758034 RepID=UPI001C8DF77C|nr:hypothetical protein [Bacillus sp. S/N-304-OC-R1]MBY0120725.1 hypothetical protein [Bacillus sp. S/N-304-OC-R1]